MSLNCCLCLVQLATVWALLMVVAVLGQSGADNSQPNELTAAAGAASNTKYVVDLTTSNGNHIQMPPFMANLTSINPELREYLVEDITKVSELLGGTLDKRLRSKSNMLGGAAAWALLAGQMTLLGRSQSARRRKLGEKRNAGTGNTYNKAVQAMFKQLLDKSQEEAKKLKGSPKRPEAVADDVKEFFSDLLEVVNESPVATYFDWKNGQINGKNFVDSTAKIMAKLIHNGYQPVFSCVETLLNLLVSFSG